jgi:hypothetical protein
MSVIRLSPQRFCSTFLLRSRTRPGGRRCWASALADTPFAGLRRDVALRLPPGCDAADASRRADGHRARS